MEERAALLARVSADHGTEIRDPATGEVIGQVAFGTPGDVAAAVETAAKPSPAGPRSTIRSAAPRSCGRRTPSTRTPRSSPTW